VGIYSLICPHSADVISASIGGLGGWSKGDALSDLINDLTGKGHVVVLAAGNEGSVMRNRFIIIIVDKLTVTSSCRSSITGRAFLCGVSCCSDQCPGHRVCRVKKAGCVSAQDFIWKKYPLS
jgi:hypothetical protein